MPFSEFEIHRYETILKNYCDIWNNPGIRDKLYIDFRIEKLSIFIFEVRPRFDDPNIIIESPVAKATYVKSTETWKIYWMRAVAPKNWTGG
jgi:hypothetical protein